MYITDTICYIGTDDKELDLFESRYVIPDGVTYNSYLILDEKVAVMDTVDARKTEEWLENLKEGLSGREPDYLVISHMEPDHGANVARLCGMYPQMQVVGNARTFALVGQFFDLDVTGRKVEVKEGDALCIGEHTLSFMMAPMVHWPEVMVTYDQKDKVLFSADAFGKFGALDADEGWIREARRYYFNIVGKYGAQVQSLLKKAASLDIETICPLHGPVLQENLEYYLEKYRIWSAYEPEDEGVLIAYASIHGNTAHAAGELAEILRRKGAPKVVVSDLAREDMAKVIGNAFRYDKMVVAAATYDGGLFPCMEEFLSHLNSKAYQNRKTAIVENGSWAPMAGKIMREMLGQMKNVQVCKAAVTIKSAVKAQDLRAMEALADELLEK